MCQAYAVFQIPIALSDQVTYIELYYFGTLSIQSDSDSHKRVVKMFWMQIIYLNLYISVLLGCREYHFHENDFIRAEFRMNLPK